MSELFGAIKTLFVSLLIVMALQLKIGGQPIEYKLTYMFNQSGISKYFLQAASGAVLSIKQAGENISSYISEKINSNSQDEAKAGRSY